MKRTIATSSLVFMASLFVTLSACGTGPEKVDTEQVKSPEQMEWESLVSKADWPDAMKNPAFQFVKDDPLLPRVLLIGDSISVYYTEYVRKALSGKANVHRIPGNGGATSQGLKKIDLWLGSTRWDVIHFNFGLHDLKRLKNGQYDVRGEQVSSPDVYAANLEKLIQRLKQTKAKLIWASTTPVPERSSGRLKGDDLVFNATAAKVMAKYYIKINDLHSLAEPHLKELQKPNDVHFNDKGSALLGQRVADEIAAILENSEPTDSSDKQ